MAKVLIFLINNQTSNLGLSVYCKKTNFRQIFILKKILRSFLAPKVSRAWISSRPSQLSSSLRRQVWSAVKRLDTISPKLLIMFDAHLGWCNSEIFKVATNIFLPYPGSNPIPFSNSDDATTNWVTPPTHFMTTGDKLYCKCFSL